LLNLTHTTALSRYGSRSICFIRFGRLRNLFGDYVLEW
jgi:hypothetical protein